MPPQNTYVQFAPCHNPLAKNVTIRFIIYGTVELVIAAIGFSIQIYCDFSSYSMIAIGADNPLAKNVTIRFKYLFHFLHRLPPNGIYT